MAGVRDDPVAIPAHSLQFLDMDSEFHAETLPIRHDRPDARRRSTGTRRDSGAGRGGLMQLTRWNPFAELDQIQQRLNRLFLERTVKPGEEPFADFMPAVDIEETDNDFIVKADLPDVKKEEIKVHVQEGIL